MERIVLIGPPGAGKSTIGKLLAKTANLSFLDTDTEIESMTGRAIRDIFLEDGEGTFREIERKVVLEALSSDFGVVSLGGGSILNDEVYHRLELEPLVIYLQVSISNAAPRVGFNNERPMLLANPRQQWLQLLEARKSKYEALSKVTVSTDNRKPREVVEELLARLDLPKRAPSGI